MKVLLLGSGGREHALAWKMAQSPLLTKLYCLPGNGGTAFWGENLPPELSQPEKIANFVQEKKIDLTVVGPEAPLIAGIADFFARRNLKIIGPQKKAAQIEGSKVFAKKIMEKYQIPTANFLVFKTYQKAVDFLKKAKYPLVVKADGPCFGKGVKVCQKESEAEDFLSQLMVKKVFGAAGEKVIIEECLFGQEISFTVVTDGKNFVSFLPSQDHKRVFSGDRGPNTGGMGAYAPVPFVNFSLLQKIEKKIVEPLLSGLRKEGCPYQGILYPGLILTREGPKVLEFNCRFGDPETQPLLMLLQSDLLEIFQAIIQGKVRDLKIKWRSGSAVCVVLAAKGYPGEYVKGKEIFGLKDFGMEGTAKENLVVFHAGTKRVGEKFFTTGGRVLGITAWGRDLREARRRAYQAIGKKGIYFSGMHYREDIGEKGLRKELWLSLTKKLV